ncbi:uncharacterized protein [Ptychodera flava]|uniref:uncharacterized protein n=1 Tax=Ptychodera flava TaxID=63121 RepID=UPI00396A40D0
MKECVRCLTKFEGDLCQVVIKVEQGLGLAGIIGVSTGLTAGVILLALILFLVLYRRFLKEKPTSYTENPYRPWTLSWPGRKHKDTDYYKESPYWDNYSSSSYGEDEGGSPGSGQKDILYGRAERLRSAMVMARDSQAFLYPHGNQAKKTVDMSDSSLNSEFILPYVADGSELARDEAASYEAMDRIPIDREFKIPRARLHQPPH